MLKEQVTDKPRTESGIKAGSTVRKRLAKTPPELQHEKANADVVARYANQEADFFERFVKQGGTAEFGKDNISPLTGGSGAFFVATGHQCQPGLHKLALDARKNSERLCFELFAGAKIE